MAKKKKRRKFKAIVKLAKAKPRDKRNRFVPAANLSDEEILTRLLKKHMLRIPKVIPITLLAAKSLPNINKLRWCDIIKNHLIILASTTGDAAILRLLYERIEGKVPETILHGLEPYSAKLIKAIREKHK